MSRPHPEEARPACVQTGQAPEAHPGCAPQDTHTRLGQHLLWKSGALLDSWDEVQTQPPCPRALTIHTQDPQGHGCQPPHAAAACAHALGEQKVNARTLGLGAQVRETEQDLPAPTRPMAQALGD